MPLLEEFSQVMILIFSATIVVAASHKRYVWNSQKALRQFKRFHSAFSAQFFFKGQIDFKIIFIEEVQKTAEILCKFQSEINFFKVFVNLQVLLCTICFETDNVKSILFKAPPTKQNVKKGSKS